MFHIPIIYQISESFFPRIYLYIYTIYPKIFQKEVNILLHILELRSYQMLNHNAFRAQVAAHSVYVWELISAWL